MDLYIVPHPYYHKIGFLIDEAPPTRAWSDPESGDIVYAATNNSLTFWKIIENCYLTEENRPLLLNFNNIQC